MPESEDRGTAVIHGVAANDNPGSKSETSGGAETRTDSAVAALARIIGRSIALEG